MTKGRRERDRPKVAPGALYNPNKRVKLSYDSDSEDEADAGAQEQVTEAVTKAEHIQEAIEAIENHLDVEYNDEVHDIAAAQAGEQDEDEAEAQWEDDVPTKAAKEKRRARRKINKNRRTGQLNALGVESWQGDGTDEEEGGSPDPAMEYLRAVRSERKSLPAVLGAVQSESQGDFYSDDSGRFDDDHAIIAAPDPTQLPTKSYGPREAFTKKVKQRFYRTRNQVQLKPPATALATLGEEHPFTYPPGNKVATAEWIKILASIAPVPAQICSLDQDTTLRLLQLIRDHYLQRQKNITAVTSAWIWALLAKSEEVGLMDNDQVFVIRALGKQAVLVQVSFRSSETAAQLEQLAGAGSDAQNDEAGAPSAERLPSSGDEQGMPSLADASDAQALADRENTLATLDSVLVIVGEIYGQRDLLEFRQPWEAEMES